MRETDKRNLPDGWRWMPLGEICEFSYGSGLPERLRQPGKVPVYGSNGIVGYHNESVTNGPTIIVGRKGSIGEVHFSPIACWPIDTTYYIERTKVDADLNWLTYWLRALNLRQMNKAAAVPGLNREDVYSIVIPLPPPDEQRRIAAILSEQLAAVERARIAAEAQLEAASALPAAYLREVFESEKAKVWPIAFLGDAGEIASGITLGRKFIKGATRKVPYLRVANVKDGHLDLADVYEIDATEADIAKCQLKYGDMLLTEGGDADKLGRGTFWEEQIPLCLHQNHIFRVRFVLNRFSPQFVSYQMGSPYGKAYFLAYAKQTTGIATINQKVLSRFPLMMPSFEEQQRISAMLQERMASAERSRQALEAQLDGIHQLSAALLRQAFNGKL